MLVGAGLVRAGVVALSVLGLFGGALGVAAVGSAEPAADPILCQYTMSDPQVVEVSGTKMVNASLTPSGCNGTAEPTSSQVCLSTGSLAGRCAELPGYAKAQVYLSPYVPGQSYTVRGRGCANQAQPPLAFCTTLGPKTVTL